MSYQEIWQPYREDVQERYELVMERLEEIKSEETVKTPYLSYFRQVADFLRKLKELEEKITCGQAKEWTLEEWQQINHKLYEDILPQNYEMSFGNPKYAVEQLGEAYGKMLCMLYADIRSLIPCVHEGRIYEITIFSELLVEIYNCFEEEEKPEEKSIQQIIYWFFHDYGEIFTEIAVKSQSCPELDFEKGMIQNSDWNDLRYLYQYGAYISENEIKTAEYLSTLPQSRIQEMANTYTQGYQIGFEITGKDLSKKKYAEIRYSIGFERMMRAAIQNFETMGLQVVVRKGGALSYDGRDNGSNFVESTQPNRQYLYDHKSDRALYLDKALVERRLEVLKNAYELEKEATRLYAGPAVMEVFGEAGFEPKTNAFAYQYTEKQQKLNVYYSNASGQIVNEYIPGNERSFTIIAYPIPEIGEKFEEIFDKTVEINTLDYKRYQKIQQKIITVLDEAEFVHVTGKGKNTTDLTIAIYPKKDMSQETAFENCVADVNIPVGEVFTSPVLKGTNGRLHVSKVYLDGLQYLDLQILFQDGMIQSYSCKNFETEEENQGFLKENLLKHHNTLPMGEFAIGTNTTAYKMGVEYQIQDKLPILIAEKTGPHFAVGDTCYSWSEDTAVFNPDGKEIVARENEISAQRKIDVEKAYFNCHTDITIPYDELDCITVIRKDGTQTDVIADGKFVVPGTEELNIPLEKV
ncbi:MAG: aminopeptidase [Lachnospiraceae bacterium]